MTASPAHVKLIVLDIDGTLIERDASLPDGRAAAFASLVAAAPTLLATGKTAPSIAGLIRRFGLPGPHVICNGAALLDGDGRIEVLAALDEAVADEVMDTLTAHDVAAVAYLADGSLAARAPDRRFAAITALGEPEPHIGHPGGIPVLKILAVLTEDEEGTLRAVASDRARIQRTGPSFLEWNAPTAAKGEAIRVVAARHGVQMADVVAIGDSENDASMLAAAGWGIAVRDSSPAAIAAADEHLDDDVATVFTRLAGALSE